MIALEAALCRDLDFSLACYVDEFQAEFSTNQEKFALIQQVQAVYLDAQFRNYFGVGSEADLPNFYYDELAAQVFQEKALAQYLELTI